MSRHNNKNQEPMRSGKERKAGRNAPPPTKSTHERRQPCFITPAIGCHVSPKMPYATIRDPLANFRQRQRVGTIWTFDVMAALAKMTKNVPVPECIERETYYDGDHPDAMPYLSIWDPNYQPNWEQERELQSRVRRYLPDRELAAVA